LLGERREGRSDCSRQEGGQSGCQDGSWGHAHDLGIIASGAWKAAEVVEAGSGRG